MSMYCCVRLTMYDTWCDIPHSHKICLFYWCQAGMLLENERIFCNNHFRSVTSWKWMTKIEFIVKWDIKTEETTTTTTMTMINDNNANRITAINVAITITLLLLFNRSPIHYSRRFVSYNVWFRRMIGLPNLVELINEPMRKPESNGSTLNMRHIAIEIKQFFIRQLSFWINNDDNNYCSLIIRPISKSLHTITGVSITPNPQKSFTIQLISSFFSD